MEERTALRRGAAPTTSASHGASRKAIRIMDSDGILCCWEGESEEDPFFARG